MWRVLLFSKEASQLRFNFLVVVFFVLVLVWLTDCSVAIRRIETRLSSPAAAEAK